MSEHSDELHLEAHGLAGERVVEIEQNGAVGTHLAHGASIAARAIGRGELHHVAHRVLLGRVAQLVQELARHPLLHLGLALAKGLARGKVDHRSRALFQADQALLDGG